MSDYEIVWSPDRGWRDHPELGRGALLPAYASGGSLTEAIQVRGSQREATTPRIYSPERKAEIQRLAKSGNSPAVIAKFFDMPESSVKNHLYGQRNRIAIRRES